MPSEITDSQLSAIIAKYNGGATLRQLGELYGVSRMRIKRMLASHNIPMRQPGRRPITSLSERKCCKCKTVKEIAKFMRSKREPSGHDYTCKSCRKQWNRGNSLKKTYGITVEMYVAMVAEQGGRCAICRQPESRFRGSCAIELAVDHCHSSGLVRGLLCGRCNTAIGLMRDDVQVLQKAINYLSNFKNLEVVSDIPSHLTPSS